MGSGGRRNADTYWVFNKKRIKVYVFVELSQTIISKWWFWMMCSFSVNFVCYLFCSFLYISLHFFSVKILECIYIYWPCIEKNTSKYCFYLQRVQCSKCQFGFIFDIDGVIVRGRKPLPTAREAFQLLVRDKQFTVPTLFVTNAGNSLRSRKAQQLSEWLGIEVCGMLLSGIESPLFV